MITIYNNEQAVKLTDPTLSALVEGHLTTARENGLQDLTCIAVAEAGDGEADFIEAIGFSPLHNPLTDNRFGDPAFTPSWDWLEVHPSWYELIYTVGDDGFAFIVFAAKGESKLAKMCALSSQTG